MLAEAKQYVKSLAKVADEQYYGIHFMNKVTCPHCKKQVEISEAIVNELQAQVREQERKSAKAEFEKNKAEALALERKKTLQEVELKNIEKDKELEKQKEEKSKLEIKLLKVEEDRKKDKDEIIEKAKKDEFEKYRLDKAAYEKKISDMQKLIDEAKRKGDQGSQQLQGDVLELDLEERLRQAFPYDEFKPVPTGVKGGDIIQEIKNKFGNSAGFILWEAKRQKTWQKKWLVSLKENMREVNANDCILVSDLLPLNVKIYDRTEGVWVTSYEYVIKLATVIRYGLLNVAIARSTASHSDEQLKELYRVITSDSFRQMFEARDEIISAMRLELEADKRGAEKRWKRQGAYIEKLDRNNSRIYGELQSYIPSLKPLKETELLQIEQLDSTDS